MYRDEINSLQIQLSRTQAGPGRAVKEQQEQNSPNHVQRISLISVLSILKNINFEPLTLMWTCIFHIRHIATEISIAMKPMMAFPNKWLLAFFQTVIIVHLLLNEIPMDNKHHLLSSSWTVNLNISREGPIHIHLNTWHFSIFGIILATYH